MGMLLVTALHPADTDEPTKADVVRYLQMVQDFQDTEFTEDQIVGVVQPNKIDDGRGYDVHYGLYKVTSDDIAEDDFLYIQKVPEGTMSPQTEDVHRNLAEALAHEFETTVDLFYSNTEVTVASFEPFDYSGLLAALDDAK